MTTHQEDLERWVEALESGEYEQGTAQLRTTNNKWCCIGVWCNIIDPTAWQRDNCGEWRWHGDRSYAPQTSAKGLSSQDQSNLASLNDRGQSFRAIASVIRQDLLHQPDAP